MEIIRRYEGVPVAGESATRQTMPFLMRGRNESIVMLEQRVDVTELMAWLARENAGLEEKRVSFFQVVLAAIVRTLGMRPKMNRFVVGQRLYQRKWLDVSFAVKKRLADDASMSAVKVRFEGHDTLETVARRVDEAIGRGREVKGTSSESEMRLFLMLPRLLRRLAMGVLRTLDYFNLMPGAMIRSDELYTNIFLANLGSVGMEAPLHHLYEWGTCPLFGTIGRIAKEPVVDEFGEVAVKEVCCFKWSFDERITDGFYCARSLDLFKHLLAHPELLATRPGPVTVAAPAEESGLRDATM